MENETGIVTLTWSIENFFVRAEELKSIKNYKLDPKKWHSVGTIEPSEMVTCSGSGIIPRSSARIIFSYFTSPEFKVNKKHIFKLYLYPQGLMRGNNGEITDNMAIVLQLCSDHYFDDVVMLCWKPDLLLKNFEHKKYFEKIISNNWSSEKPISNQVQQKVRRTNFIDFNLLRKHLYNEKNLVLEIKIKIANNTHRDLKFDSNDDKLKNKVLNELNDQDIKEQIIDKCDKDYILAYYNVQFHRLLTNSFPFNEAKNYEKMLKDFFLNKQKQHQNVFVYFLIDPRGLNVSQNDDLKNWLDYNNSLKINYSMLASFICSIFYIGKGKNEKPFDHFKNYYLDEGKVSTKNSQIKEIYKSGHNPIVLFAFCGLSNDEAITRKSMLIESMMDHLTNKRLEACKMILSKRQRDVLSAYFVFKAFIMFQIDGGTTVKLIAKEANKEAKLKK